MCEACVRNEAGRGRGGREVCVWCWVGWGRVCVGGGVRGREGRGAIGMCLCLSVFVFGVWGM